jgi:hypothetical protein
MKQIMVYPGFLKRDDLAVEMRERRLDVRQQDYGIGDGVEVRGLTGSDEETDAGRNEFMQLRGVGS